MPLAVPPTAVGACRRHRLGPRCYRDVGTSCGFVRRPHSPPPNECGRRKKPRGKRAHGGPKRRPVRGGETERILISVTLIRLWIRFLNGTSHKLYLTFYTLPATGILYTDMVRCCTAFAPRALSNYHARHTAATLLSCMGANRIVPTPTPIASFLPLLHVPARLDPRRSQSHLPC